MTEEDDFGFYAAQMPQKAFHLEMDLYDTGEYHNLLVSDMAIVFSEYIGNQ